MVDRLSRINELIGQQLGQIINTEIEFPMGSLATITRVKTSTDLRQAQIWVGVIPDNQASSVIKILNQEAKNLQKFLNQKLTLRAVPRLKFFLDQTEKKAAEIDELLDRLS